MGMRLGVFVGLVVVAPVMLDSARSSTGEASAQSAETFDAWVAFADKGLVGDSDRVAALRAVEESLDSRALALGVRGFGIPDLARAAGIGR